jgi:hypothetical protein
MLTTAQYYQFRRRAVTEQRLLLKWLGKHNVPDRGMKPSSQKAQVEFTGEVRAADLDKRRFSIRLDDGTKVIAEFSAEQERAVTEALREHTACRLRLKADVELARTGKIKRVDFIESPTVDSAQTADRASKPIWEIALEVGSSVPEEEWAKMPTDLGKNLHHYLYGSPLRSSL